MEATFNLALTYHEAGNNTDAEKYYLRTLQLDPNLVRARLKLAELYTETNRKKEAIEQYRQIFYIAPSIFVHHPTLGPEHQYINVFKKFRSELETKLQREPNSPKYNLILAKVFQAQGQYGKAANLARKVLTFSPNNSDARKILAQIEHPGQR
jgi:Tfp pilus assembly protein PilF